MSNPDVRITLDESADSDAVDEGAVAIDSIIIDPTTYVIPSEEQSLDVDQLGTEVAAEELVGPLELLGSGVRDLCLVPSLAQLVRQVGCLVPHS
jgi:hypothetical protein